MSLKGYLLQQASCLFWSRSAGPDTPRCGVNYSMVWYDVACMYLYRISEEASPLSVSIYVFLLVLYE